MTTTTATTATTKRSINDQGLVITACATAICGGIGFVVGIVLVALLNSVPLPPGTEYPAVANMAIIVTFSFGFAALGMIAGFTSWVMCFAFMPRDHVEPNEE